MPTPTTNLIDAYEARRKQGYGCGRQENYKPWLDIRNTHSSATRCQVWSPRFGRALQFLSHGEYLAYLQFEWRDDVIDIREQVPLDPTTTLAICGELKVLHPGYRDGGHVMTTDLVVSFRKPGGFVDKAFQIKRSKADLANKRTATKLFIEAAYWKSRQVEWQILYSSDFPKVRCANLKRLAGLRTEKLSAQSAGCMLDAFRVWQKLYPDAKPYSVPDDLLTLPDGGVITSETAVLMLAAHRIIRFPIDDMRVDDCVLADFTEEPPHAAC